MPRVLINATNLHVGGGVQVAASFISEMVLGRVPIPEGFSITVLCSSAVAENLQEGCNYSNFELFKVVDVRGWRIPSRSIKRLFYGFDVCFTIFGPFYFDVKCKVHVCGFAQPWIAYPKNVAYSRVNFLERSRYKLMYAVKRYLFMKYDFLVVEQCHVKKALLQLGFRKDRIFIVNNCVSSIFDDPSAWEDLNFNFECMKYDKTLGFVGRAYPHKNVNVLRVVDEILREEYGVCFNFVFTFTDEEMASCGFDKLDNFYNLGPIKVTQCPRVYENIDALIFPSLLECYSVTPIEAMKMRTTVIASHYEFVTDVCGDAAYYFDPLDPKSIANAIYKAFSNSRVRERKKEYGLSKVQRLPDATDRAEAYLSLLGKVLDK